MSFSTELKEEISKTENLADKKSVEYELIGYLISNHINIEKDDIKFTTENEYNINRFSRLLSNLQINDYKISIQGKIFSIIFKEKELEKLDKINLKDVSQEEAKWIIRGAYLGGGSINNPENTYHLELSIAKKEDVEEIIKMLKYFDIKGNIINKKKGYSIYLKDGEEISKFLAFIGANNSVLKFEENRVIRDVRNNVNRIVNCETANLNKVIQTAVKQIEDIKLIKKKNKWNDLSKGEKELAELRLKNPELSLTELGKMLENPISKSGVNHRMKAIEAKANNLKSY